MADVQRKTEPPVVGLQDDVLLASANPPRQRLLVASRRISRPSPAFQFFFQSVYGRGKWNKRVDGPNEWVRFRRAAKPRPIPLLLQRVPGSSSAHCSPTDFWMLHATIAGFYPGVLQWILHCGEFKQWSRSKAGGLEFWYSPWIRGKEEF